MSFKTAKLRVLMREMALLTEPECASVCKSPHSCCDSLACEITREYAKSVYGIDLEPTGYLTKHYPGLLFMGPEGCVVEPYLRPICTVHTCEINSLGFKTLNTGKRSLQVDKPWTEEYFELRTLIDELMYETGLGRVAT